MTNLRQRLLRIERDAATRAARDATTVALLERQPPKRVYTVEELHAAFEQYMPQLLLQPISKWCNFRVREPN